MCPAHKAMAFLPARSQNPNGIYGQQDFFNGSHLEPEEDCMVDADGLLNCGESMTLISPTF
jgi:hypothetical protein